MSTINYSDEDLKLMNETKKRICQDMLKLWYAADACELVIPLPNFPPITGYSHLATWRLIMNDNKFYLKLKPNYSDITSQQITICTHKNGKIITPRKIKEHEIWFLENYEKIRWMIEHEIVRSSKEKEETIKQLKKVSQKYQEDIIIDLGLSESLNQTTIEVEEQDGKKIGTINFGSHTIKIITNGDIELVSKEKTKQKTI